MFSKPTISPKTLGLDIRNDVIHAVLASVSGDEFTIIQTYSEPVPEAAVPRDAQRDVLKAMVAKYKLRGLKTVLSSSSDEPMGTFAEVMPEGRGIDTNQWALTQLESKLNGTGGAYIADASVSRVSGQRIVSYLKRGEFESRMSMVRDAGLVPLAFDAPILAWQRRLGKHFGENADGLLDLDGRPTLYLFKEPVGYVKTLSATEDMSVLAREITQYLRERRRNDHDLTINALYVHGPGNVSDIMMELSTQDRAIELHHLSIPTAENPKDDPQWAFASALATWDVPGALGMRANLINADKRGVSAFGRRFGKGDIVPGVAAVLAAVVVVAATEIGFSSAVASVNASDSAVNSQVAIEEIHAKRVAVIQTAVERLRTIDRDRFWLERSGRIVALRMVDLANAIPQEASISRMSHDRSGWRLEGGGGDLSRVAQTQDNLEKASPGQTVMMLDETHTSGVYGFQMTITGDPTALAPVPPTRGATR